MAQQASSQQFIEIEDIRDGVIILKNKGFRAILRVSSINFALKSGEEQNAIIFQFQNFLNSLDFSIQIMVQSRFLDIADYLKKIKSLEQEQENELLRIQSVEYREFVQSLVETTNIMRKDFYVVIPFTVFEAKRKGFMETLKATFKPPKVAEIKEEDFARYKGQLWQRVNYITEGLARMGIYGVPLNSKELIQLFWSIYNPGEAKKRKAPTV